jgi:Uma2 family endonuclease
MESLVLPVIIQSDVTLSGPPQGAWTAADWEALPDAGDGHRYEIIDGVLYMSTAPSYFHQYGIKRFYRLVGVPAEDAGLAHVDFAPIGVFMPGCDPVQPDLIVVLAARADIIRDRRIYGVPDLIVEVLSPSTRAFDESVKLKAYARCGVPEYVIIDLAAHAVRLYALTEPGIYGLPATFSGDARVTLGCLPTITFRAGDLFDGAPDTTL